MVGKANESHVPHQGRCPCSSMLDGTGARMHTVLWEVGAGLFVAALLSAHVILVPSTKVEESFTLQAVHDLWTYGLGPGALAQVRRSGLHSTTMLAFLAQFLAPLSVLSC